MNEVLKAARLTHLAIVATSVAVIILAMSPDEVGTLQLALREAKALDSLDADTLRICAAGAQLGVYDRQFFAYILAQDPAASARLLDSIEVKRVTYLGHGPSPDIFLRYGVGGCEFGYTFRRPQTEATIEELYSFFRLGPKGIRVMANRDSARHAFQQIPEHYRACRSFSVSFNEKLDLGDPDRQAKDYQLEIRCRRDAGSELRYNVGFQGDDTLRTIGQILLLRPGGDDRLDGALQWTKDEWTVFPNLSRVWSEVRNLTPRNALGYLERRMLEAKPRVEVLGFTLDESVAVIGAPAILVTLLLYLRVLLVHLDGLEAKRALTADEVPWIAVLESKLSKGMTIASLVAVPSLAVGLLVWMARARMPPVILVSSLVLGLCVLGLGIDSVCRVRRVCR